MRLGFIVEKVPAHEGLWPRYEELLAALQSAYASVRASATPQLSQPAAAAATATAVRGRAASNTSAGGGAGGGAGAQAGVGAAAQQAAAAAAAAAAVREEERLRELLEGDWVEDLGEREPVVAARQELLAMEMKPQLSVSTFQIGVDDVGLQIRGSWLSAVYNLLVRCLRSAPRGSCLSLPFYHTLWGSACFCCRLVHSPPRCGSTWSRHCAPPCWRACRCC